LHWREQPIWRTQKWRVPNGNGERKRVKKYEFSDLGVTLDGASGTLSTQAGEVIDLRPQSREVLRLLAAAPNRTITKKEFTDKVWDGRMVGEDSLVQCIADIRSALGDRDRKIIATVPRKGYRFVPDGPASATYGLSRGTLVAAAAILLTIGLATAYGVLSRNSAPRDPAVVAVLPLDDMSAAPYQGYLSDALSEGIIADLARFPQFRVIARNSSFQFRDRARDVRDIGSVLGAGYLVEGSQQYDGERIQVTVQLVDTETGVHLLSDSFERDLDDFFAVQNEIVRDVASVVGQSVLTDLPERVPATDIDSRLRGLQARRIMTQLNYENWQKALALEETSIREEPQSAWGYIGKSLMLGAAAALGWLNPRDEVLDEATRLAETAMKLDPENYMSHYTLARVLSRQDRFAESILHFQRAADLNPSDSIVWIGMSVPLLYTGETWRAIEVLDRAAQVDPLHGDWLRWQHGLAHWQADDCQAGLAAMHSMASPPVASNKALAAILVCLDRVSEAREVLGTFLDANPDWTLATEIEALPADWRPEGMAERWLDALKVAGLPG
jgi:TolB-like protein/DNA-binding winged helix-turn-helix (wHTH) protein